MRVTTLLAALVVSTTVAIAQTPAVKSPSTTNPAAPVPGANSFTEGQAKSKIESSGFTQVSGLKKDDNGFSGVHKKSFSRVKDFDTEKKSFRKSKGQKCAPQ